MIAEETAPLGEEYVLVSHALRLPSYGQHVLRCHELAFLDVERLARLGGSYHQIGLSAQESRNLQHVRHLRDTDGLIRIMYVREDRDAEILFDPFQNPQTIFQARSRVRIDFETICLAVRTLEYEGYSLTRGDLLYVLAGFQNKLLRFDHAGARYESQRVSFSDIEIAKTYRGRHSSPSPDGLYPFPHSLRRTILQPNPQRI